MSPVRAPAARRSRPALALLTALASACAVALSPAVPAQAVQIIRSSGPEVAIELGQGTLVRLDHPAAAVFIADPEICDIQVKSPRLIYLLAKKPGRTTLYAVDDAESVLASLQVAVSHDLGSLDAAVRQLYPDAEIAVSSVRDAVVIDGAVATPRMSEDVRRLAARFVGQNGDVINRLDVTAPTQVNLRVRVAEVSRDVEKQLGINWAVVGRSAGVGIAFATLNPFAATGGVADLIGVGGKANGWDINAIIDALSEEGLISVLAEPNLTALSGETASFLAGGEFPILVPQGDDGIVIEFKKFGVSLAFTPTVLDGGRITLHVRPEVSDLTNKGAVNVPIGFDTALTVPALTTRRAETTVELGSGQSFAIAGLLANNSTHDIHKLPFLGDIPILGRLFTSDAYKRNESELVIIVTPYLVRPSPGRIAAPNDGLVAPRDVDRLIRGGTWTRQPQAGPGTTVAPDGTRLIGPGGFVLE